MNENLSRNTFVSTHCVGADVAKSTFDAALVRSDQHYPDTPLRKIPVQTFERSVQGVRAFLSWLDAQDVDAMQVRVVMEATGNYSTELALWMLSQPLRPAIANPRHTSAFIKSMGVRNKTDRPEARALGFYGVERRPPAYPSTQLRDGRTARAQPVSR